MIAELNRLIDVIDDDLSEDLDVASLARESGVCLKKVDVADNVSLESALVQFEEYHELSDGEVAARTKSGERFVFCFHPHGVFPFVATCAMISSFGAPCDAGGDAVYYPGSPAEDFPTAVASVLRWIPLLKDVVGLFGVMDASAAVFKKRLARGSAALQVRAAAVKPPGQTENMVVRNPLKS